MPRNLWKPPASVGAVELAALWLAVWELVDADFVDAGTVEDNLFDAVPVDSGNVCAVQLAAWELVDAGNVDDDLLDAVLVDSGKVGAVELAALWLVTWELVDADLVDAGNVDDDLLDAVLVDSGNAGAVELAAMWLAAWELVDADFVNAAAVAADLVDAVPVDAGSVDSDLADPDLRRSGASTLTTPAQPSAMPGSRVPAGTTLPTSSQAVNTAALLRSERRARPRQRKAP